MRESAEQPGDLRKRHATARPSPRLSDQLVTAPVQMEKPREKTGRDAERTRDCGDPLPGGDPREHGLPSSTPRHIAKNTATLRTATHRASLVCGSVMVSSSSRAARVVPWRQ